MVRVRRSMRHNLYHTFCWLVCQTIVTTTTMTTSTTNTATSIAHAMEVLPPILIQSLLLPLPPLSPFLDITYNLFALVIHSLLLSLLHLLLMLGTSVKGTSSHQQGVQSADDLAITTVVVVVVVVAVLLW